MKTSFLLTLTFFLVSIGCSDKNNPVNPSGNDNSIKIYLTDTVKINSGGVTAFIYIKADKTIWVDSMYCWCINQMNLGDTTFWNYKTIDTIPINWKLWYIPNIPDSNTIRFYEIDIYKFFGKKLDYPYTLITDSVGIKYLQ
jgi:hypothetical protein